MLKKTIIPEYMNVQIKTSAIIDVVIIDVILLTAACLIPTVSHLLAVPLYKLNPMLALLLMGILLGRDWRNALLLAVLMPFTSYLLVGMPTAPKMFCMMAELATVVGVFSSTSRHWNVMVSIITAIMAGKCVYYLLKACTIAPAVLVDTAWWIQLGVVILWGVLFGMIYKKIK